MKAFIEEVANLAKTTQSDLIEKDIILHNLLKSFSEHDIFKESMVFKGGTCLIKTYLGYFRFSEDLDFTWASQSEFENLKSRKLKKALSSNIANVGNDLEKICNSHGLRFRCNKSNRDFIEISGGGRRTTYKMWYDSELTNRENFVKLQLNFIEKRTHPSKNRELKSLLANTVIDDLENYFPDETSRYVVSIPFLCYDIREIMVEKIRSVLTRLGIKARDFIDIYLINRDLSVSVNSLKKDVLNKMFFALEHFKRYKETFRMKKEILSSGDMFEWGSEKKYLMVELDETDFYNFINKFNDDLKDIVNDLDKNDC
jgi:predicted nucleotidyltransferase component of viral defense system